MSILIRGMEMPTSCNKCPFLDYEEGFCFASGVKHESGWYESTLCPGGIKDGRHDDCPLVPVPAHGRLIDADALLRSYEISPHPTVCHGCRHEDGYGCGGAKW
jgi:hypothetical protein